MTAGTSSSRAGAVLAGIAIALLVPARAALAAPPPNDQRSAPAVLALPASVTGTTRGSTLEADEPGSCEALKGSVWYAVHARQAARIAVRLDAAGDLDAVVDVFQRVRSQLSPVDCDIGDAQGRAELDFRAQAEGNYLIRVGQRANSVAGDFRLDVFAPQRPPTPPGRALPRRGARGSLDALQHTAMAYAVRLRAGRTYRINLAAPEGGCVSLALYSPGTTDFDSDVPVEQRRCGGYLLFTPAAGEGGRYALLVQAARRRRGRQRYHVQVAPARRDDTAPGLSLHNYRRAHGRLDGTRIDAVDLYRFSLARRSDVRLTLGGPPFRMVLLNDRGRRLTRSSGEPIELRLRPGRYYVAVIADGTQKGRYVLQRAARTITRTSITIDGVRSASTVPGAGVSVGVHVTPGVGGPVSVTLERFDPLAGWQFFRRVALHAVAGSAVYRFTPPSDGRWRASADFAGTRVSAPSESRFAHLLIAPPLGAAAALVGRLPRGSGVRGPSATNA